MKKRNLYNKQNTHSVHVTFVCTSYGGTKKKFDIALMYYDVCEKCKLNGFPQNVLTNPLILYMKCRK